MCVLGEKGKGEEGSDGEDGEEEAVVADDEEAVERGAIRRCWL